MKRYKVIAGVLQVSEGARVGLSPAQVAPRAHKLNPVEGEDGVFTAAAPLQFKTGEVLAVSEIARFQRDQVEDLDPPEAELLDAPAPGGRRARR